MREAKRIDPEARGSVRAVKARCCDRGKRISFSAADSETRRQVSIPVRLIANSSRLGRAISSLETPPAEGYPLGNSWVARVHAASFGSLP
jgi:hypothetical protein